MIRQKQAFYKIRRLSDNLYYAGCSEFNSSVKPYYKSAKFSKNGKAYPNRRNAILAIRGKNFGSECVLEEYEILLIGEYSCDELS